MWQIVTHSGKLSDRVAQLVYPDSFLRDRDLKRYLYHHVSADQYYFNVKVDEETYLRSIQFNSRLEAEEMVAQILETHAVSLEDLAEFTMEIEPCIV